MTHTTPTIVEPAGPRLDRRTTVRRILSTHLAPLGHHGEYAAAVPAMLAALGPHLAPDEPAVTGPALSTRELEVLRLVASGHSNRALGERLGITEDTVKTHLRRIMRRLEVRDRAHAVARGFRMGILR